MEHEGGEARAMGHVVKVEFCQHMGKRGMQRDATVVLRDGFSKKGEDVTRSNSDTSSIPRDGLHVRERKGSSDGLSVGVGQEDGPRIQNGPYAENEEARPLETYLKEDNGPPFKESPTHAHKDFEAVEVGPIFGVKDKKAEESLLCLDWVHDPSFRVSKAKEFLEEGEMATKGVEPSSEGEEANCGATRYAPDSMGLEGLPLSSTPLCRVGIYKVGSSLAVVVGEPKEGDDLERGEGDLDVEPQWVIKDDGDVIPSVWMLD